MPLVCPERTPVIPAAGVVAVPGPTAGSGGQTPGNGSTAIGGFQEGPGLVDVAMPVIRFLRQRSPRPLSQWQLELASQAWPSWQADLLARTVTFLWFLAGGIAVVLIIIGMIALLWELIGL